MITEYNRVSLNEITVKHVPTIREAKEIARKALHTQGLTFEKLSARTISFSDLARASCIFVKVHGLGVEISQPNAWDTAKKMCKQNGFCIE